MTVCDPNVSRILSINQRTRKIPQNIEIPFHKNPPREAELLELILFHFRKECGRYFRGGGERGQVVVICGGGGGEGGGGSWGRGKHELVRDDHVLCACVCLGAVYIHLAR